MNGIVLSRRDVREYDQMISLYTKDSGKQEFMARGIKKITSKNAAHLEPCSYVHVGVAKGKEKGYITTVQSIEYFPGIRMDWEKAFRAQFVLQTTDRLLGLEHKDEAIFDLLHSWLVSVEKAVCADVLSIDFFFLRLMVLLGFLPQMRLCVVCHNPLAREGSVAFSFVEGGLVCAQCQKTLTGASMTLSDRVKEGIETLLFSSTGIVSLSKKDRMVFHRFVYGFMQFQTERVVSDWYVVEKFAV